MAAWVEASATVLAFLAAGVAAFFAWRTLRVERRRDERRFADGLSAWWTKDPDGKWGILISNPNPWVFAEVQVASEGNKRAQGQPIEVRTLPPGYFFTPSAVAAGSPPWGLPMPVQNLDAYTPITQTDKYRVTEICYRDINATRWRWSPENGLSPISQQRFRP